MGEGVGLF